MRKPKLVVGVIMDKTDIEVMSHILEAHIRAVMHGSLPMPSLQDRLTGLLGRLNRAALLTKDAAWLTEEEGSWLEDSHREG